MQVLVYFPHASNRNKLKELKVNEKILQASCAMINWYARETKIAQLKCNDHHKTVQLYRAIKFPTLALCSIKIWPTRFREQMFYVGGPENKPLL
jgi:hypothetical protein